MFFPLTSPSLSDGADAPCLHLSFMRGGEKAGDKRGSVRQRIEGIETENRVWVVTTTTPIKKVIGQKDIFRTKSLGSLENKGFEKMKKKSFNRTFYRTF